MHPDDLVARIKGALKAGLGIKFISARTGIPHQTIKQWKHGDSRADIEPDPKAAQDITAVLLGPTHIVCGCKVRGLAGEPGWQQLFDGSWLCETCTKRLERDKSWKPISNHTLLDYLDAGSSPIKG